MDWIKFEKKLPEKDRAILVLPSLKEGRENLTNPEWGWHIYFYVGKKEGNIPVLRRGDSTVNYPPNDGYLWKYLII